MYNICRICENNENLKNVSEHEHAYLIKKYIACANVSVSLLKYFTFTSI